MPAMIAHYLFAQRVFAKLKKAGAEPEDRDMAAVGAQGPDLFFFHRVLPWEPGVSFAKQGSLLHKISPAKLFEAFRAGINRASGEDRAAMIGYVEGFFCHYALDRAAHPFVYYWQEELRREQPGYGTTDHQYHFRIESALDTITLRRETGRLVRDFKLASVIPSGSSGGWMAMGRLYQPIFARLLGCPGAQAGQIALAPRDMRRVVSLMTDRTLLKQRLLIAPVEKLARKGAFASSLMRPADTRDWDYANEGHARWVNPFDTAYESTDSFFDLFDLAACEATDMILAFLDALSSGASMADITQDRGFASDLPGVYEVRL